MIYVADPRVGDYINGPQEWQQAVCREVHEDAHYADRQLAEALAVMSDRSSPTTLLEAGEC